jgi:hypothetical protein
MDVQQQETQVCIEGADGAVVLEQRIRTTRERFTALLGGRPRGRASYSRPRPRASGWRSTSRGSATR